MVESVAPGKPEGHVLKDIRTLEARSMGLWPLQEQLDRVYHTLLAPSPCVAGPARFR